MDKLFEGLDENANLSVKEMKSRFLAYEAEKKKKEDDLQTRMEEMNAMLKNLSSVTTTGVTIPVESYNQVNHDYPKNTSPMPHINNCGPAPQYDGTHFSHWKSSMESHIRSCSVELWEIIVEGLKKPNDPSHLSSREFYDRQLNASARDKIRSAIHRKLLDQVNDIDSAKVLWDRIVVLQEGTNLIQKSFYETAKTEANMFMIKDGETLSDAYARLCALRVKIKGLGCDKYHDGFDVNDEFMKSKIIAMIACEEKNSNLALNLQILSAQGNLSPDDLVSYFVANENLAKQGKKIKEMNRADCSSHSLALKAKVVQKYEEYEEIEEEEEMTSTSDIGTDFAFFAKKYRKVLGNKFPSPSNEKKRTCYNCDEDNHFANECPYEKRVDKPKYVKGVKPRLRPNPINERYKKNKGRQGKAFVGAEYTSDEESEDEEKEVGVAGLAFSKPGSLFTYDYSKDYSTESATPKIVGSSFMARETNDLSKDSSSSKVVGSCLMARETKVIHSPPSLSSILDDNENDDQDEDAIIKSLFKVRCTLRGDALVKFDFLMDSLNERDESIEELESHIEDEKRRFNLLRQELKNERCITQGLKQQFETFELDKAKDLETIERAQLMAQELDASKKELEVAHASLTKDLDHLEKANKLTKDELKKLGENHDLLQATYKKALGSLNGSIDQASLIKENANLKEDNSILVETNEELEAIIKKHGLSYYPTSSLCDVSKTLEENVMLRKELDKLGSPKHAMTLDDLLSNQRSYNNKQGLGYVSKTKKKNFKKNEKPAQEKIKKVIVGGNAPKGKATNNDRAGINNPHYTLFKDSYGDVYAKYVGPRNGYAYRWYSIWVPKDLVAIAKEPINRWVPKSST